MLAACSFPCGAVCGREARVLAACLRFVRPASCGPWIRCALSALPHVDARLMACADDLAIAARNLVASLRPFAPLLRLLARAIGLETHAHRCDVDFL